MRLMAKHLLLLCCFAAMATGAAAEDERFAIRFGLVGLEPTSDSTFAGVTTELGSSGGGEFDFEWYFMRRAGLEGSVATVADADVDEDNDTVAGIALTPLTVGVNWHIIRNTSIDWAVGVLAGSIVYGDFEFEDGSSDIKSKTTSTYGVQSSVDIGVAKGGRWAVNVGLKYLKADLEPDLPGAQEIDVDPLMYRVMGVFRF